jgi:hypothetical protein
MQPQRLLRGAARWLPHGLSMLLIVGTSVALPRTAAAASLEVTVDSLATLGDLVEVDLQIFGLGDLGMPSLSTFDVTLAFDSNVLDLQSVSFGDQLDLLGLGSIRDFSLAASGNAVNLFELSLDTAADLDALQRGSFTLASLAFRASGVGSTSLDLTVNALGDALAAPLSADVRNGSVTVARAQQPVPEPLSMLLVLSGGSLVAGFSLRESRRRQN